MNDPAFDIPAVRAPPSCLSPDDVAMPLPDGVHLATRVWRPDGAGPWPVLLMRLPYGRTIASTATLAHPSWYAAQGYVVAVQEVRGTGSSGGAFDPFAHEAADGAQATAWARALPGGDGRLGLYGFSYQGMTQTLALAGGGTADAIAPVMAAWDLWSDFASEGGALRLDWTVAWAMQMGALAARRDGDDEAHAAFAAAAETPPLDGPEPALPEISRRRDLTHLAEWIAARDRPAFWAARSPARVAHDRPEALATPALHVGGWFDPFLNGTVAAHEAWAAAGADTRLVIGPWTHMPWREGGVAVDRLTVEWLDHALKGAPFDAPPLRLWDLTRREWCAFDAWPAARLRLWLTGDGLAAAASTGSLVEASPRAAGTEVLVHDPWRPVPARGHHLSPPFGMAERTDLDARADVAVFTSTPRAEPLRLVGAPELTIAVRSDGAGHDLHAVLSLVGPDGDASTLTLGHARATTETADHRIRLRPVMATVEPGERLRLSLSGAAWPAFAVNPGTGAAPELTSRGACVPITLALGTPATLDLAVEP
jgi:putative CocE/NonD family hydrolase